MAPTRSGIGAQRAVRTAIRSQRPAAAQWFTAARMRYPGGAGGHAGAVHHGDLDAAFLQEPRSRQSDDPRPDDDGRAWSAVNPIDAHHHAPSLRTRAVIK